MNADAVIIPFEVFLRKSEDKSTCANERLVAKVSELRSLYSCFRECKASNSRNNTTKRSDSSISSTANDHWGQTKIRKPIQGLQIADEEKKRFISLLNKCTPEQVETLFMRFTPFIQQTNVRMYVDTCFEYMKRSPAFARLYCDIIHRLSKHIKLNLYVQSKCKEFVDSEIWVPSHVPSEEESYDEFCEYTKWRRMVIATIQAFVFLVQVRLIPADLLRRLIKNMLLKCAECNNQKLIEIYLHFLLESMASKYVPLEDVRVFLKQCKRRMEEEGWIPAAKFKLLDVEDVFRQKMK
jgi:hypothetical protein